MMWSKKHWMLNTSVLFLLLQVAFCAVDLGIVRDPNNEYGRWGSIVTWKDNQAIDSNEKLAGIARQGCKNMKDSFGSTPSDEGYVPKAKRPSVMSVLRIENTLYMSSSIRGFSFVYVDKTGTQINTNRVCDEISLAMQRCILSHRQKVDYPNDRHGNQAGCGDVMALQVFCKARPEDSIPEKKGVLLTYDCGDKDEAKWFVSSPCEGRKLGNEETSERTWGCKLLLEKLDVTGVKKEEVGDIVEPSIEPESKVPGCIWGS